MNFLTFDFFKEIIVWNSFTDASIKRCFAVGSNRGIKLFGIFQNIFKFLKIYGCNYWIFLEKLIAKFDPLHNSNGDLFCYIFLKLKTVISNVAKCVVKRKWICTYNLIWSLLNEYILVTPPPIKHFWLKMRNVAKLSENVH